MIYNSTVYKFSGKGQLKVTIIVAIGRRCLKCVGPARVQYRQFVPATKSYKFTFQWAICSERPIDAIDTIAGDQILLPDDRPPITDYFTSGNQFDLKSPFFRINYR